jgi:hypothetical protein
MSALGHSVPMHSAPVPIFVCCYSNSGQTRLRWNCPLSATTQHDANGLVAIRAAVTENAICADGKRRTRMAKVVARRNTVILTRRASQPRVRTLARRDGALLPEFVQRVSIVPPACRAVRLQLYAFGEQRAR